MGGTDSITLREVVARNVRLIRNKIGISQEQLADIAELHRTYIGSIERAERNVSIDNIAKIARALKVKPTDLLSEEGKNGL
jgi:transcriptional regulator with XRE-family HTH domain